MISWSLPIAVQAVKKYYSIPYLLLYKQKNKYLYYSLMITYWNHYHGLSFQKNWGGMSKIYMVWN